MLNCINRSQCSNYSKMSTYSLLEPTLNDILCLIHPSDDDWSIRFYIIAEVRAVVQSVESLRGATVEPYGSFVSNLFTRWGDLDISIELLNGSHISSPGKKHKQSLLGDVLRALRKKGGWRKLQLIANARIPILKFERNYPNISCDISINNLSAQMKSKLLFWINEIDGRFRDMVLLVKEWAKAHDINDSKSGTLNSYCLSLLVIFHFQTCLPAILPPLKEIYPGNMVHDLTGVRAVAEKRIEQTCGANINRFKAYKNNRSSLSELFISFLAKFSDISSRATKQGINPYSGQWEEIESNMTWLPKTFALFVEDPFEQPLNTARSVNSVQLARISEAFQTTYRLLISEKQNRSSLIDTLVRREISPLLARTLARNPSNYGGDYPRTHPQMQRAVHSSSQVQPQSQNSRIDRRSNNAITHRPMHSPSQVQQQFQNMRIDGRSNNAIMHRPVQANHSQGQQMWRPKSEKYEK